MIYLYQNARVDDDQSYINNITDHKKSLQNEYKTYVLF